MEKIAECALGWGWGSRIERHSDYSVDIGHASCLHPKVR